MCGREGLGPNIISKWADLGEAWLRGQFKDSDLLFHTSWSIADKTITLCVYRKVKNKSNMDPLYHKELLFEVTEDAEGFVSPVTLTKIILVA